jgi:hypothetical protein
VLRAHFSGTKAVFQTPNWIIQKTSLFYISRLRIKKFHAIRIAFLTLTIVSVCHR